MSGYTEQIKKIIGRTYTLRKPNNTDDESISINSMNSIISIDEPDSTESGYPALNDVNSHEFDIRAKIETLGMTDEHKKHCYMMLKQYEGDRENFSTSLTAIEMIISIYEKSRECASAPSPGTDFRSHENMVEYFNNVWDKLEQSTYGHHEAKLFIIQYLICRSLGLEHQPVLGLCGPSGIGKTTMVMRGMAKAMGLPFYQVSLGGLKDSSLLNGTAKYWKGSHPGILAKILAEKGPNCVVYLDEIDKVSMEHAIDIYGYLTHAFDPVTNNRISDNYLGIELDFSGLTFVLSFNDPAVLSTPLLDRISTVYLKDFTRDEKVTIVQSYLLKEVLTSFRIPTSAVQWEQGVPEYIVDSLLGTEGVRSHKRLIHKIISTLLIDLLDSSSGCQQLADHSPGLRLAGTGKTSKKGKTEKTGKPSKSGKAGKSSHTGFKFRFNRRQITLPYSITLSDVH